MLVKFIDFIDKIWDLLQNKPVEWVDRKRKHNWPKELIV